MKRTICLLALLPFTAFAQNNAGMPEGMQNMLQQAQKAQACMQEIDQSQLENMEKDGKKKQAIIKSLCDSGNRDEAQEKAIGYSKEVMARPEMVKIRECSEMLRGMIPELPFDNFEEKYQNQHVCDDL